ncbi:MAG: sn-glycerol-3-phosphate ABC transporter ATP-binding protein UgpC [Bauldia sp.]|nr:sn-glycerol-3-phosphate ABC transporter ATP-binding protein UgpC [Bauldia sp.]
MADVTLANVTKSFGDVAVIKGVDLSIGDGEFCVFVGPSGCGKSTLLRLVAGLEDITSGELRIGGRDVTRVEPASRGVAMVFQSYALYPHMSVRDNISFGLRMAKAPSAEIDRRVRKAAGMLQLDGLLDRKPSQLSGGQRQRVAIGRAIVREPGVFLFDEPLSNLDAALRVQTRIEIGKLHQDLGTTMVYVTHDQVEAMTMADKIVVLNAGRIEQVGSPLELYHRPRNRFVAGFIGSPKMNFMEVDARSDGGHVAVDLPGGGRVALRQQSGPVDGRVVLGVRPEHLLARGGGDAALSGTVRLAEHLGGETMLYVDVPGAGELTVRSDGLDMAKVGDPIAVGVPAAACHLFDSSGAALVNGSLL